MSQVKFENKLQNVKLGGKREGDFLSTYLDRYLKTKNDLVKESGLSQYYWYQKVKSVEDITVTHLLIISKVCNVGVTKVLQDLLELSEMVEPESEEIKLNKYAIQLSEISSELMKVQEKLKGMEL